jgi:hypothetical protein
MGARPGTTLDAMGSTFCATGSAFFTAGTTFFVMKFFSSGAVVHEKSMFAFCDNVLNNKIINE